MTTAEIQQYVYNFLYEKQLPHLSICAIMGNITAESSWDVNAIENGNSVGFGLCQWSFGRRTVLEAYGTSLKHQCEFLWSELTGRNIEITGASYQWKDNPADSVDNGEGFSCTNQKFITGDGTIEYLTKAFCYCWERPAFATNHLNSTRIPSAQQFNSVMKYTGTESQTSSSLYVGPRISTPYVFTNNTWKAATPYIYYNGTWICGTTDDIWTRRTCPELNNKYYNCTQAKVNAAINQHGDNYGDACKVKEYNVYGISTSIVGHPVVLGLSTLRNCVGAAWGAFNETWAINAPNNGPVGGFYARPVEAKLTLDECKKDSILKDYVVCIRGKGAIPNPDTYIPPLGGIIVWAEGANHVAYISQIIDANTIEIQQSSWGGARWPGTNNGDWYTKSNVTRGSNNTWWFNNNNIYGKCIGFIKNPAFNYDSNGNCLGKKYT